MALSTKTLSLLFLAIFLLSHHSQARDSQFFSKVTDVNNNEKEATTTTAAAAATAVVNPNNKKEEEPAFIPETKNDGYGLYGHESGQFPPTNEEQHYTTNTNTQQSSYEPYTTPVGHQYKPAETQGTNLYANNYNNDNDNENNNNNNNFGGNKYDVEMQGMSDTRFLENGKYFYDVSNEKMTYNPNTYDEKNYDPNTYTTNSNYNDNTNSNSNYNDNYNNKAVDYSNPKNWYNNRRNSNNNNNYYGNNVNENTNSYEPNKYYYNNNYNNNKYNNNNYNNNSFEGYQNEEEFQENEEFVP